MFSILVILFQYVIADLSCLKDNTCTTYDANENNDDSGYSDHDPSLKEMIFDVGDGEQSFMAYIPPDVSSFYQEPEGSRKIQKPHFNGFAGKFYNLCPFTLVLMWDDGNGNTRFIGTAGPFQNTGTATFPGHQFLFTTENDPPEELIRFVMNPATSHYVYDPYDPDVVSDPWDPNDLNPDERPLYEKQKKTLRFNKVYRDFTGRDYQSLYPRNVPMHKMWSADYYGQQQWVETKETHFVDLPPEDGLKRISKVGSARKLSPTEPRILSSYRTPGTTSLNLTLNTLSIAPRVFSIPNFLSPVEIDHVIQLSTGMSMKRSSVQGRDGNGNTVDTRTSRNVWVYRETSPIVDAIYRRAADLLRIDEALLRHRSPEEFPDLNARGTIAEALQLVHYGPGQQYTAHHDWGYADVENGYQPSRFATVLLYLNEGMEGGETSFPRWMNGHTTDQLKCVPKSGQAVMFYSILPDGNLDDLSQHAALPIIKGEKWLMNLWVWDPIYGK